MVVGALEIRLRILGALSLKEKRKVLKSIKDRVKNMNISVAEVGDQDLWQAATIGFAAVSNEAGHVNAILDKLVLSLGKLGDVELLDSHLEILHV